MSLAEALPARSGAGFVPFIVAGDPSWPETARRLRALAAAGAAIIELGVPFSDPVADGPVIQEASERALRARATLKSVLRFLARERARGFSTPVILFTYLNPVLSLGARPFAAACRRSGVQGVLAVDLAAEESGPLSQALAREGVELVLLAAPTTSDARLRLIGRRSGSLVYYVSREGVTGARQGLPPGLSARLARVRRLTGKPLLVGFGVARPAQARALAPHADGVVVGSALVAARGASFVELARALAGVLRRTRC